MEWSGWNRTIALVLVLGAASCGVSRHHRPLPSRGAAARASLGPSVSAGASRRRCVGAGDVPLCRVRRWQSRRAWRRVLRRAERTVRLQQPHAADGGRQPLPGARHVRRRKRDRRRECTVCRAARDNDGRDGCRPGSGAGSLPLSTKLIATSDGAELRADVIADQLTAPTSLASSPDGRLFVAERDGRISIIRGGALEAQPAITIDDALATAAGDGGLVSIALDREFERTHFLYAVYTVSGPEATRVFRVVRYREVAGRLGERIVILDGVAAAARPAAAIDIGPDGNLYVAFDAGQGSGRVPSASYSGKVLRLSPDGTTPKDQAAGPVLASDFVSPRGLDWNPETGTLWVVDAKTATRRSCASSAPGGARRRRAVRDYRCPRAWARQRWRSTAARSSRRLRATCSSPPERVSVPPAPARRCARPVER